LSVKHTLLIIFVVFVLGSAYPTTKLGLNASVPPILFGSLRMFLVFICLVFFCDFSKFKRQYLYPLILFGLSMGMAVNLFLYLSVNASNILAPIQIITPLSIPLAILLSSIFIGEKIKKLEWILIFTSLFGAILIGFDPKVFDEFLGLFLMTCMTIFYALAQVSSRYIKDIDVKLTNCIMGLIGFLTLLILSLIFEGDVINNFKNINSAGWILVLYHGIVCSLMGHMMMFYLYKFYPVGKVLPFYALLPVFGIIISFFIFGEIPTPIMTIAGIIVVTSIFFLQKIR